MIITPCECPRDGWNPNCPAHKLRDALRDRPFTERTPQSPGERPERPVNTSDPIDLDAALCEKLGLDPKIVRKLTLTVDASQRGLVFVTAELKPKMYEDVLTIVEKYKYTMIGTGP